MLKNFKPRLYQETIFETCVNKNTLVVLPTGMGKTSIAMMLAVHRITNFPTSKILFLAPTKPLVVQHKTSFSKTMELPEEELIIFTGDVAPAKRPNSVSSRWE